MTENTKTLLIVGGLALAGVIAYRYMTGTRIARNASGTTTTPTNTNSGNWWDNLGQYGGAVSGAAHTVEQTYNTVAGWFGSTPNNSAPTS